MCKVIEFSSSINKDREALFVWANLPQQRETYPDFEKLLYALPYRSEGQFDEEANTDATYVHLAVSRDGCKGLYIRLNKHGVTPGPHQLAFLSKMEQQGYAAANCFNWEEARDVIIHYMSLVPPPSRQTIYQRHVHLSF